MSFSLLAQNRSKTPGEPRVSVIVTSSAKPGEASAKVELELSNDACRSDKKCLEDTIKKIEYVSLS